MHNTDQLIDCHPIMPGKQFYKGRGLEVVYGYYKTPAGELFVALSDRSVCFLGFAPAGRRSLPVQRMKRHMPHALFCHDDGAVRKTAMRIMDVWKGKKSGGKIPVILSGTEFQQRVWNQLLTIGHGETVSYKDVARAIGKPKGARAVGGAVGANPISLLVPCHRVVQSDGNINNYGWGNPIKKRLLELESGG